MGDSISINHTNSVFIDSNIITDSLITGIDLRDTGASTQVIGNDISSTTGFTGIRLQSVDGAILESNRVTGGNVGILVAACPTEACFIGGTALQPTEITAASMTGIQLFGNDGLQIRDTVLTDNLVGIRVQSSKATSIEDTVITAGLGLGAEGIVNFGSSDTQITNTQVIGYQLGVFSQKFTPTAGSLFDIRFDDGLISTGGVAGGFSGVASGTFAHPEFLSVDCFSHQSPFPVECPSGNEKANTLVSSGGRLEVQWKLRVQANEAIPDVPSSVSPTPNADIQVVDGDGETVAEGPADLDGIFPPQSDLAIRATEFLLNPGSYPGGTVCLMDIINLDCKLPYSVNIDYFIDPLAFNPIDINGNKFLDGFEASVPILTFPLTLDNIDGTSEPLFVFRVI